MKHSCNTKCVIRLVIKSFIYILNDSSELKKSIWGEGGAQQYVAEDYQQFSNAIAQDLGGGPLDPSLIGHLDTTLHWFILDPRQ